jgi:hypothetical protein
MIVEVGTWPQKPSPVKGFNLAGARNDGIPDAEIAEYLKGEHFVLASRFKDRGLSQAETLDRLSDPDVLNRHYADEYEKRLNQRFSVAAGTILIPPLVVLALGRGLKWVFLAR